MQEIAYICVRTCCIGAGDVIVSLMPEYIVPYAVHFLAYQLQTFDSFPCLEDAMKWVWAIIVVIVNQLIYSV